MTATLPHAAVFFLLTCLCTAQDGSTSVEDRTRALERWAAEGNEERVRSCLGDEASGIRVKAAGALLEICPGDADAMALLRVELRSKEQEVADAAACTLASEGTRGTRVLVEEVRQGSARAPALFGLVSLVPIDPATSRDLKDALVQVLSTSTTPRELANCMALAAGDPCVARACAPGALLHLHNIDLAGHVLGLLEAAGPDESFVTPLHRFLQDEQLEWPPKAYGSMEYKLAASILCRSGPKGVRVVLDQLAADSFERHKVPLIATIEKHSDLLFDALWEAAHSPKPLLRLRALGPLTSVQDRDRVPKVTSLLRDVMLADPDADVRAEAADRLFRITRRLGELEGEQKLRTAVVEHPDERVRLGALYCLLEVNRVSVEFLAARLDDPSKPVRLAAVRALGASGPRAASSVEKILALLDRGDSAATCIGALARIAAEDDRALGAVSRRLDSQDERVAYTAAWAAAIIGPRGRQQLESRLRSLPPARADSVRLWRRYALWKVTALPADLRPLMEDLEQSVRHFGERIDYDLHSAQILTMLGPDARPLVPVINEALKDEDITGFSREQLEKVLRVLDG